MIGISSKGDLVDLNPHIRQIMDSITKSQNLCKLIYYKNKDPLGELDISDFSFLQYKNIFPFRYVPNIETDANIFINITFRDLRASKGKNLINGYVYFYILCHRDLMQTYYGLRIFCILSELQKIFNNKDIGIGKMKVNTVTEFPINNVYDGYLINFEITDFI